MEQRQAGAWRSQESGMTTSFAESVVEQTALAWLESVGWSVRHGTETAPGGLAVVRSIPAVLGMSVI